MKEVEENNYIRMKNGFYEDLKTTPYSLVLKIRKTPSNVSLYKKGLMSFEKFIWEKLIIEKALIDYNYVSRKD